MGSKSNQSSTYNTETNYNYDQSVHDHSSYDSSYTDSSSVYDSSDHSFTDNSDHSYNDNSVYNSLDGGAINDAFNFGNNIAGEAFDSINQLTEGAFGMMGKFVDSFTTQSTQNSQALTSLAKSNSTGGATDLIQAGVSQNNTMAIAGVAGVVVMFLMVLLMGRKS